MRCVCDQQVQGLEQDGGIDPSAHLHCPDSPDRLRPVQQACAVRPSLPSGSADPGEASRRCPASGNAVRTRALTAAIAPTNSCSEATACAREAGANRAAVQRQRFAQDGHHVPGLRPGRGKINGQAPLPGNQRCRIGKRPRVQRQAVITCFPARHLGQHAIDALMAGVRAEAAAATFTLTSSSQTCVVRGTGTGSLGGTREGQEAGEAHCSRLPITSSSRRFCPSRRTSKGSLVPGVDERNDFESRAASTFSPATVSMRSPGSSPASAAGPASVSTTITPPSALRPSAKPA